MARIYPAPPRGGGNGHEERSAGGSGAARAALPVSHSSPDLEWDPTGLPPGSALAGHPSTRSFPAGLTGRLLSGAIAGGLIGLLLGALLRRKMPALIDK